MNPDQPDTPDDLDDEVRIITNFSAVPVSRPEPDLSEWSGVAVGERWPVVRTGDRVPINRITRRLVYLRDRNRCGFCDKRGLLELDHIIPWSAGGPDTSDNLRSLCHKCNDDRSNYRTESDRPAIPVTLACDYCIAEWIGKFGVSRYGRCIPGAPEVIAFCGNCQELSIVTQRSRLR